MQIGTAIKRTRERAGMRQNIVAGYIGISQTYLSLIEGNQKEPSFEIITRISEYYKTPLAIMIWNETTEDDVPEDKRGLFKQLKPLVDSLLNQLM